MIKIRLNKAHLVTECIFACVCIKVHVCGVFRCVCVVARSLSVVNCACSNADCCKCLCMSRPACGSDFPGMAWVSKLVTVWYVVAVGVYTSCVGSALRRSMHEVQSCKVQRAQYDFRCLNRYEGQVSSLCRMRLRIEVIRIWGLRSEVMHWNWECRGGVLTCIVG